ncbi:MAG: cation:dicarboxylase symporter family transporter, partial [Vicinamibacterales bacterium]
MTTATSPATPGKRPFYRDLSFQVLVGMGLGVIVGHYSPQFGPTVRPLGDAFIRLIQMVVGPVIFCSVVGGIAGVGDMKKVGRVAIVALIYFEVVTSLALVIGLVTINVFQPGVGMNVDVATLNTKEAASYITTAREFVSTSEFLLNIVPRTMIGGFAEGEVLQILFVSVLVGLGLAAAGPRAQPMLTVVNSFAAGLFWVVGLIMKISPIAAFGAIGFTVSRFGVGSLGSLGMLILVFYLTCALF